MTSDKAKKLWGGRFTAPTDEFVEQFTESVSYDKRLAHYDIAGSIAHVKMLAKTKIISKKECDEIIAGLKQIEEEIASNQLKWSTALEDVHINIESVLVEHIGEVGKKLHTARSRNDQIATDIRLYLRDEIDDVMLKINEVMTALITLADEHYDTIMPGLTHMQSAQPITFGHHLLAWVEMLLRDRSRLEDCRVRVNVSPLGSAALAGTTFPIDRNFVAKILGFDEVTQISLDAVSDRDFIVEFLASASLIMMHLSRFSEEIVLWMSQANQFINLDDAWCTGSSIMPQKKNPDIPELVRGKTGRVYGNLLALLTIMKAQPLAYNRDNQEDKAGLFDAVDTVKMCLTVYAGLIPTITVRHESMLEAAEEGYTTATDLADYLVVQGLAFRDAHAVVGKVVQYAIKNNKLLSALSLSELQQYSELIKDDVFAVLKLEGSVLTRNHVGGTAPAQVKTQIARLKKQI
ncbi:MAG: argininosuccinate lyase [Pseudomonadota bacterium]|nr:argininosuccinate lyase [Pseudomonadota bacterium]